MATFIASQATDMRVDLWRGIVVAANGDSIVATDGTRTALFAGDFSFPGSNFVGGGYNLDFPGFLDPFNLGPVSGTLTSYTQDLGTAPQFTIDMTLAPAGPIFHAVSFENRTLATALLFAGFDTLIGSAGADRLLGFGAGDTLSGLDGADRLSGGQGTDFLSGGDGNDRLSAGADPDTLRGDAGNDTLTGDAGPDQLTGGAGADTFRYRKVSDSPASSGERDTIRDFAHGLDLVDLRRVDADANDPGNQAFTFIGAAEFTDTPGQLRYASGRLSGDTDGDGHADFQIALSGRPTVDAGDLLL
jgi:Ca2+-binding RTX toxin-like protein